MRPLVRVVSALAENVQVPALESAWDRAIGERSAPGEAAGPQGAALVCEDWRGVPGEEQPTRWNAFLTSQRDADLGPSRRARLTVIRLAEADSRIVWTFPEDGLDRGERARLVREVLDDYRSRSGREGAAHPAPDLVAGLEGRSDAEAEAYWRAHLEGVASAPLSIGRGSHGRPSAGRASAREELRLPPDTRSALEALAAEHELPLATWVQGAWSILLSRYGDCEQILFGVRTTTPGAVLHERSLPLRVSVAPHASLLPWLRDLRDRCSSHARFGDVFVDTIRDWCDIPRDAVLFDSETDLERSDAAGIQAAPAVVEDVPCSLSLRLVGGPDLRVCIDYRSDGFERDTIKSLLRHLTNLLEAMGSSPDGRLGDLPMLGVEERHRLLFAWNDTARELPSEQCMHRRFEARVRQAPHAFAVSFEQQRLTYAELNGRANQLARSLRRLGVGPDVLVGICLGRCLESVVAMLGVLKAGGAFVPLDPDYPLARLCFMLRDTRVPVLLTRDRLKDLFARVPEHDPGLEMPKVLRLDADWASIAVESAEDLEPLATPDDLAYAIYTSGSTGEPKGVLIEHRGLCNVIEAQRSSFGVEPGERVLQFSSASFDASIFETVMALGAGAELCIVPPEARVPGTALARLLRERAIGIVTLPPSVLAALPAEDLPALRTITVAGEACPADLVARWGKGRRFFNLYGPTESSIWATVAECEAGDGRPSIGRPIANTQVYLLDSRLEPVPVGVPGELYIGGVGLARGYLGRPELTAERFVPHPFSDLPGARLYRTGDVGRFLPDGNIEFLGRNDDQVKIRGFRIELGEIEATLCDHPTVTDAAVVSREDTPGDPRLVAYVVPNSESDAFDEIEREQIAHWKLLRDEVYAAPPGDGDPSFNLAGWIDSYTGNPFPAAQMHRWVDDTVERITALEPRRVLEIGCGVGLLLSRIAPGCERYCATDVSSRALSRVRELQAEIGGLELLERDADDFSELPEGGFDTVILHSVVQYFPSVSHLLRVIEGALRVLQPGGTLWIGDVRSLPLLEAFHASIVAEQASGELTRGELRERIAARMTDERELVLDPTFFTALSRRFPELGDARVVVKRGRDANELTRFRYDVIIRKGPREQPSSQTGCVEWEAQPVRPGELRRRLAEERPERLELRGIPNPRVSGPLELAAWLHEDGDTETLATLRQAPRRSVGIDPEELWAIGRDLGYATEVTWARSGDAGCCDVSFRRAGRPPLDASAPGEPRAWCEYANDPLRERRRQWQFSALRRHLETRLPSYMLPAAIVPLDALPLTLHGKVDRRRLPAPPADRSHLTTMYTAPRTDLERTLVDLWQRALGLDRIGVHDDFFELGGDSLRGSGLVNAIKARLGEQLYVAALFDAPSVAELATYLEEHFPESIARLCTPRTDGRSPARLHAADATAGEFRIDENAVLDLQQRTAAWRPLPPPRADGPLNPPMCFVLTTPRSGSSLLRIMMGGNPRLFAPPELELLAYDSLRQRREWCGGRYRFMLEGTLRAVMDLHACGAEQAERIVAEHEGRNASTRDFYRTLQEWIGDRLLIDKSATYSFSVETLERAEACFENARYIHLVRHPYGTIRSFEEARLDRILDFGGDRAYSARELAELLWIVSHRNILGFLDEIPAERQLRVDFESLVGRPESVAEEISRFLGVPYDPEMLEPYRNQERKMTDGINPQSVGMTDPKFHDHDRIDRAVADQWRQAYPAGFLSEVAWELAEQLGYAREEPGESLAPSPPAATSSPGNDLERKKRELVSRLLKKRKGDADRLPIARRGADEAPAPLSFAQEGLWLLDRMNPGATGYNTMLPLRFEGDVDLAVLQRALDEIVRRHEILRTSFSERDGQPVQLVAEPAPIPIAVSDLRDGDKDVRELMLEELATPFDLERGPLFRVRWIRVADAEHVLLLSMHHAVFDGWSGGVVFRELCQLYEAFSEGRASPLHELPVQYGDYALWQRQWLRGDALDQRLAYWRERLAGAPVLELPTDHPRPAVSSYRAIGGVLRLPVELSDALRELSRRAGVTPFMTLLAAFQLLMQRYSGQDDIVVGSPVTLRRESELEPLIGFFVNMVAMRTDLSGSPSFRELLARVRETSASALQHADLPFDTLVRDLQPRRDLSRNPLFQVAFTIQQGEASPSGGRGPDRGEHAGEAALRYELPGLAVEVMRETTLAARFDIEAFARDDPDGMYLRFSCSRDLFDEDRVERLLGHYRSLLEGIAADPERPITELGLLTEGERRQVVGEWSGTVSEYPREARVHELFEAQVDRAPDRVAVSFEGRTLSYGELDARANRVANYLRKLGVRSEDRVGLCVERSLDLVVGTLGILKAGGAYLPLDPEYPASRLAYMLDDAGAPVLLTQSGLRSKLPEHDARVVCLDTDWDTIGEESETRPGVEGKATDLAYVIYTSGSTGMPKGTTIPHRAVVRLVQNTDYVELGAEEVFLQFAAISFDASTFELWGSLLHGARLVIFPARIPSLEELGEVIRTEGITTLWLTTALFHQMVDEQLESLGGVRQLLSGGETLSVPHVKRYLATLEGDRRLSNCYGPTENTTFTTCHVMGAGTQIEGTVPIGRPICNTSVYLLDAAGQPVPVGVPGELCTGGDGLAREYWNEPELTAEKFVPDRFSSTPGGRLYRTGDRARYRPDGVIEFLGRVDHQVKIRGFRVEPGEIEAALRAHSGVGDAVVMTREDTPGDRRLVAWVATGEGAAPSPSELRGFVRERLPEYMVPSVFVLLERLPLNANGKVDRGALPAPEGERQTDQAYVAPRSELEQQIAAVWREVLRVDDVGIDDNFFDLGGHSLLLVRVHAKLRELVDKEFRVVELFQFPTIGSLARHLGGDVEEVALAEEARARVSRRGLDAGQGPIAIVGMAGRFPGADSVEAFWENLRGGVESITFSSEEELIEAGVDLALVRDPRYVPSRGVMDGAEDFDAPLFGYPPREAELIDPQQRVFLECAWEALERAGYDPQRFPGLIGVYAGSSPNSYLANIQSRPDLLASVGGLAVTLGSSPDFLPTRVSYKLNLRGPAVNVQTACSTSLVAVHVACRALLDHDCDLALAGGVSVKVPRRAGHVFMEEGIGSPDGHCRAFDADAQGTVGGDGVAIVVLKRLAEAIADRDTIHAVIRGTAINNDGAFKVGFTAPSVEGQAEAIALAQAAAGVEPDSIGYVEAHGTGTALGDPIEVAALTRVFGGTSRPKGSCALGGVKTNVGHLDAAAGVAGLVKTALSLEHRELAPSLNYERPNPGIDFGAGPFRVNTELRSWETEAGAPRRAGVSSFGLGGTNAHAVLEEAPPATPSGPSRPHQLVCLSARTEAALEESTARLAAHLRSHPDLDLADVAYTLQAGRQSLARRRALRCESVADAVNLLEHPAPDRVWTGAVSAAPRPVVFLFPGQGAQHPNMARELYERESVFRETVDACATALGSELGLDLRDVLFPAPTDVEQAAARLRRTALTQPALFVVEYALAQLWMSWGVHPQAMLGHSIGEYVAACLAGVFSLDDALGLVATRGRMMDALEAGSMLSVPLPEPELRPFLGDGLSLAAVNGPSLCVVSGPESAVAGLEARLEERELSPKRLHTSHAFHSAMMDPILEPFTEAVRGVKRLPPILPFVSNVSGTWITPEQATDPAYWARHLRESVRFGDGLCTLFEQPDRVLLEVGPGRTLSALAGGHLDRPEQTLTLASLPPPREARDAQAFALESLGRLWVAGAEGDFTARYAQEERARVLLPTYPFQRQRYWIERGTATAQRAAGGRTPDVGDWFYVPSWRRAPRPVVGAAAQASPWLVFAEPGPLHQGLVSRLEQLGRDVVCVFPGGGFGGCTDGGYVIDPAAREDYDRLLDALVAGNGIPDKVVHLWAARPLPDEADLGAGLDRGFYSLLHLAQALTERRPDDAWDLTAVTSRVHEVSAGEPLSPATAAALGVCRVLGLEHPRVTCRNVDLSPDAVRDGGAPLVEALMTEVDHPARDAVVALRGGQRWVQSFEPTPLAAADDRPDLLREGGTYLILGGLGAVGLTVARYLARIARANLVLAGRSGLPDEDAWGEWLEAHAPDDATSRRIRAVEALQEAGARIRVRATEVADEDALRSLVEEIEQDFGRLDGVIHAAGAEKTGSIIAQATRLDCEEQLRAKLPGLVALARVLEDRPPDFCLLCSSLSSILGASGFVAYTAAHAFMDAFAQQQSQRDIGPRWITVNWDNWNAHGIDRASLAPGIAEFLMSAEEGTDALGRVLCTNALTQVAVSTGDLVGRVERLAQRDPEQVAESETAATARHPRPDLDALFEAPRDDAERTLAGIWEALLGIDGIGIHDNFFELGGDSVVNIQIISRANQAGLKLTPKQVFEHQTIAELAALAGTGEGVDAEQGLVSGTLPPTPVQRWFLEADLASPDHFNQARVLELRPPADPDAIREALRRLLRHHDALRLRVVPGADPPELRVAGPEQDVPLDAIDGTGLSESELDSLVEARATELQPRFDLVEGPLVRAAWFDAGPERAGRLLLIIHHLVVDEVSWPMLLEDLETAYGQVRSGQEVELPPKTTSFRAWSLRLHEYAQTAAATRDLDTWVRQGEKPLRPLPVDHEDGPNSAGSTDVVHIELGAGDTQALLQDAHRAYNTQTHDLLMAALARAFARWTGESRLHVLLEGHGREAPFEGVDLTRTVGWFTTLYPAVIEVEPEADAGRVIPSVKEQLRALPRQGMSYGVLRYLSPDTEVRDALAAQPRPQAVFLYLGRAETAASDDRPFRVVPQRVGPLRSADTERGELLEISARVVDGRLGVAWTYSRNVHRRETIEALSGYFVHELSSLIAHCRAAERTEATPADFTAARLSQSDLDKITRRLGRGESGAR